MWSPLQISAHGSFVLYKLVSTYRSRAWQSCVTRACPLRTPARRCIATHVPILLAPTTRRRPCWKCGLTTKGGMQLWLRQQQQPGWFALTARRVMRPSPQAGVVRRGRCLRRGPAGPHRPDMLPRAVHQAPGLVAAPEPERL